MIRRLSYWLFTIVIIGSYIAENAHAEVADSFTRISSNESPQKCCEFEAASVCGWTPFFSSDGWHWSGFLLPTVSVPPHSGYYIWAEDITATVESDFIPGVTNGTIIAFDYYFTSTTEQPQDVYFQNGVDAIHLGTLEVMNEWTTFSYTCDADVLCPNASQDACVGRITIVSNNSPGQRTLLAIDSFDVNGGCFPQDPWCCSFDSAEVCYWDLFYTSTGWHWSNVSQPAASVPNPGSEYIWTEDESAAVTSKQLDGITTGTTFTVNYYFESLYSYADNNLKFIFQTETTSVVLKTISSSVSDAWRQLTLSCTSGCCPTEDACSGEFVIVTSNIPGNRETAGIDNFSVNGACIPASTTPAPTTTPPPPPPPPSEWCCNFNEQDLCHWSLYYQSTGWLWSGYAENIIYIPAHESEYIFVEDDSATVSSVWLPEIATGTTFNLTYYFYAETYDKYNKLSITFENEFGFSGTFIDSLTHNADWGNASFACDATCCKGGSEPCSIQVSVETTNSPMTNLVAAIDDFSVNDQVC